MAIRMSSVRRWTILLITAALACQPHRTPAAEGEYRASAVAAGVPDGSTRPKQNYRLRLGKCHMGAVGMSDSGNPRVVIIEHLNDESQSSKVLFDSYESPKFKAAVGIDYAFQEGNKPLEFDMRVDLLSQIEIRLVDVDVVSDDVQIVKELKAERLRELLSKRLEDPNTKSWMDVSIVDPPGKYTVTLIRSLVAPEDFEHIGGKFKAPISDIEWEDLVFHPQKTIASAIADVQSSISETIEQCDQAVVIKLNGKEVFRADGKMGLYAEWQKEFEISWTPNDDIEVVLVDVDTVVNDQIFSARDNSASSIGTLQGLVRGGRQGRSCILFSTQRLDGHAVGN